VVVTTYHDFTRLHWEGMAHAGVIYLPRPARSVRELIEIVRLVHTSFHADEMIGRLLYM
jgi:hypothetical protein